MMVCGQMQPTQEVVTRTCTLFQSLLCGFYLWLKSLHCASLQEAGSLRDVKFDVAHNTTFSVYFSYVFCHCPQRYDFFLN